MVASTMGGTNSEALSARRADILTAICELIICGNLYISQPYKFHGLLQG
jgi:hypothetical protein